MLGVIDGTSVLIETIPQSSDSHSVAADSKRNRIFVPQVAPGRAWSELAATPQPLAQGFVAALMDASPSINIKSTMMTTKAMMTTKMIAAGDHDR